MQQRREGKETLKPVLFHRSRGVNGRLLRKLHPLGLFPLYEFSYPKTSVSGQSRRLSDWHLLMGELNQAGYRTRLVTLKRGKVTEFKGNIPKTIEENSTKRNPLPVFLHVTKAGHPVPQKNLLAILEKLRTWKGSPDKKPGKRKK